MQLTGQRPLQVLPQKLAVLAIAATERNRDHVAIILEAKTQQDPSRCQLGVPPMQNQCPRSPD